LTDSTATECLLFPEIFAKPIVMEFDQRQGSSDGGAVLLKAAEQRFGLISSMVDCLFDGRQAAKVDHPLKDLFAQRVFSIACGYPDANDSARLAADPIHKMLLDRDPLVGLDLASQPTLSRFENSLGPKQLYRLGESLAESVIARHAKRLGGRARRVTIDLDPTDDPTHGAQQLSFFNSHYDNACYLPMMGFVTFNDDADQYLCAAVLRPGNVTAAAGAVGILRRLMALIRNSFSKARIRVRLDGGFANPELLAFLDGSPGVEYVVAMASNAVLERKAGEAMQVDGLDAPRGRSPAAIVSVPGGLSANRSGAGSIDGIERPPSRKIIHFSHGANEDTGKPCLKSAAGQWLPTCKAHRLVPCDRITPPITLSAISYRPKRLPPCLHE
jgi:hypothetical protein